MLHRYLTPQKFVATSPPEVGTNWPQVAAYNGLREEPTFAGGVDLNVQYVYIVTFSLYQWTISNTINKRKANTVFFYELTPTGELVSSSPTTVLTNNYNYTQTSWSRYLYIGANPASLRTIALTRQTGFDTQNSSGNWSSSTAASNGQILYHNGSSWTTVNVAQTWIMQPVWNAAGTHVAAPLTAGSGPAVAIQVGLTGWSGTSVTGTSSITIANSTYVRSMVWVGDILVVAGSGSSGNTVLTFLQRSGNTLSQVGQHTLVDEYVTQLTPDPVYPDRFFAGVNQRTSSPTVTGPLLSIVYNGGGTCTVNTIAGSSYPGNSGTNAWPVYPLKNNNVLLTRNTANPNPSLYTTTPTGGSQTPYNGSSFQGASGDVFVKAQPYTGAVVIVNSVSNNLRIQKIS